MFVTKESEVPSKEKWRYLVEGGPFVFFCWPLVLSFRPLVRFSCPLVLFCRPLGDFWRHLVLFWRPSYFLDGRLYFLDSHSCFCHPLVLFCHPVVVLLSSTRSFCRSLNTFCLPVVTMSYQVATGDNDNIIGINTFLNLVLVIWIRKISLMVKVSDCLKLKWSYLFDLCRFKGSLHHVSIATEVWIRC